MLKVYMIERILCHYRVPFYTKVKRILNNNGIDFKLIYGQGTNHEEKKKDQADISWATKINNKYFPFGFVWQPCLEYLNDASLVITDLANKNLVNYALFLIYKKRIKKIAFIGHYINHQIREDHFYNKFKKKYAVKCDWWFCYTENEKNALIQSKFKDKNITVFNNSIDTKELINLSKSVSFSEIELFKSKLNLITGYTGIYCGGLYHEKRIDFLIETCEKINTKIPEFKLLVLGSGIDRKKIIKAVEKYNWIHYLGPLFGKEKALAFKASDVFLCPGLVGLAVLDSFCFQVPLITTKYPFHSPEIEYLENGVNGITSENSQDSYVETVITTLKNAERLSTLKSNCEKASKIYTVEKMAQLFSEGVIKCLESNQKNLCK